MPARQSERPMVWVRPGKGLSRFGRIEEDGKRWFVQPGCTLGQLVDAGLEQLAHLPRSATIAAWLADRTLSDYAIGSTWRSGVEHLSLLLGDGQSVHLGPFSVENTKPLDGLRLQQLVPALFRLTGSADARQCSDAAFWSGRYRLDALMPVSGEHRNLAHLCLGHGGDLGWIEWVVLNTEFLDPKTSHPGVFSTETVRQSGLEQAAAGLDREMKSLFDPDGVFPRSGQRL